MSKQGEHLQSVSEELEVIDLIKDERNTLRENLTAARDEIRQLRHDLAEAHQFLADVRTRNDRVMSERNGLQQRAKLLEPAVHFAGKVLDCYAQGWGSDVDGLQLQEWLEATGLVIAYQKLTKESIEQLSAAGHDMGDFDPGDTYYAYNEHAEAAREVASEKNSPAKTRP